MSLYRDHGIVLRTYKLGEADRIVVFVTRGHGKVRAVAKGVRKTKSRFGSRLEPGSHVALQLYEGRELDIVTQAESVDHFRAIRDDLDRLAGAQVDAGGDRPGQPGARARRPALPAPARGAAHAGRVRQPARGARLPAQAPGRSRACSPSSRSAPPAARTRRWWPSTWAPAACSAARCRSGIAVSPDAVSLLQDVLGGRLNAALAEPASEATHEVTHLATSAMEHHLERRLRTVDALDHA